MMLENEKELFDEMFTEEVPATIKSLSDDMNDLKRYVGLRLDELEELEIGQQLTDFGKAIRNLESRMTNMEIGLNNIIKELNIC
jgi:hypothetical protein